MPAPQGWYDAGVPGRLRWWDGTQWTAHERAVTPQELMAPEPPSSPHLEQSPQAPLMGWYPVTGRSEVRWWDGAGWTPYRIRDGRPRADAFAVEPGNTGLVFGFVFIVLGLTQLSTASISGNTVFSIAPILFFIAGAVWLIGGFRTGQVRKLASPRTAPMLEPSTRPLPGEVEGTGAGWYPVAGRVTRWWTGSRWSPYIVQKFGVRPTLAGPRGYFTSMIVGWVFAVGGVICLILGLMTAAAFGIVVGTFLITCGAVGILVGGILLPMIYARRYTMILPTQPPPLR